MAVVLFFGNVILAKTKFGRYVYAVGNNPEAARRSGINVRRVVFLTYLMAGLFSGIGGIVQAARLDGLNPAIGMGLEFDVITAVILGGTSIRGGVGTIPGTLAGAFIVVLINTGLNLLNVSAFYYDIVKGAIILLAVVLDTLRHGGVHRSPGRKVMGKEGSRASLRKTS